MNRPRSTARRGFSLVVTVMLMVLLSIIAVGLLSLSALTLRSTGVNEARTIAMTNARLGLMMALGQLQKDLGDDRRVTADASILDSAQNPAAVGVWNGWSPQLITKSGRSGNVTVDYDAPKGQTGFRTWLVSSSDPAKTAQLEWHTTDLSAAKDAARLFTLPTSGFELRGETITLTSPTASGGVAWAATQENAKARINIGTDDAKRISLDDRMQTPSRPNLALSALLKQPTDDWSRRPARVCRLPQAELDPAYGLTGTSAGQAAAHFTVDSLSLLTDPVNGGLKVDLTTGFDMSDDDFAADNWNSVDNPFRGTGPRDYKGQLPLYQPLTAGATAQVYMNFDPASVNHKFTANGVPTFDTLRAHYRVYRHLFNSSGGGTTGFERPYSHVAGERLAGRPFGVKTHPSLAPVLDRMNLVFSVMAKATGELCILLSPVITIWNPHNVDIETEGLVVYPWIDFAVFWNYNVTSRASGTKTWGSSLSRMVGEGYQGHGRSTRPYFYLHLTQSGNPVRAGTKTVSPAIHLEPGEVRVFCMAEPRKDLEIFGNAQQRTWRMRPVSSASDLTASLKNGVILNMAKCLDGPAFGGYLLKPGDVVNANTVGFDRNTYYYIVNMADAYQIRNPAAELMVEARPAYGSLPALRAERNLYFYNQVHAGLAYGKGQDSLSYPRFLYEEINETPRLVGSLLTYHRVAQSSTLPLADLMFTTNPRQPFINCYLSGARFQTGPHYESVFQGGTSLAQLAMETTTDGRKAYYGPSHSARTGRTNLAFFEIPRSPTLSLGSFQHCDVTATAFGCASQIANSWASPYLPATSVAKLVTQEPNGGRISPNGLGVYDHSYLANEALFDSSFLSGAAPEFGSRSSATGSPDVWENDMISEKLTTAEVLARFFENPTANPLRNPRMAPFRSGLSPADLKARLDGPEACVRLAAHLLVEGGFNINSTSEEAWTAVLASLRGARPASGDKTAQSRFRHILTGAPAYMDENDPWSGFRTLGDAEIKLLAKNLVAEIRQRGPFLSLGEFVNRRVSRDRTLAMRGAIQTAIDNSNLNKKFSYSKFTTTAYPNPENLPEPNTGTNTPGWLTQADVLHGLAPFITPRSDTFIIRSLGEARDAAGKVTASVRLEALVQRVPDWVDPADAAETRLEDLQSAANRVFGRRFLVLSLRELRLDQSGNPV